MNKERVKHFLQDYLPMEFVSDEDRKSMYHSAITYDYLHSEANLSEGECQRQWKEFNDIVDEMNLQYKRAAFNRQRALFAEHYDAPIVSPMLHWNEKYHKPEFEGYTPIIAINDLVKHKYVICAIPNEKVEFMLMQLERTPDVVAQYESLDDLVRDDWRMGS